VAHIHLTMLGGFNARWPGGGPVALPTRKTEALLAVLACRPGEPQPRERLTALLWGDRSDQQARHSLNQTLTSIRRAFDGTAALEANREAVALHPEAAEIDVSAFHRLAASVAVEDLSAAAGFYRGPLLEGLNLREPAFEEWLTQERSRLHDLAMDTLIALARHQAALGRTDRAEAALDRAIALDPLAEPAHRALLRLHLDQGACNAAIRVYRACAKILKRELDTVPEPATTALHAEAQRRLARTTAVVIDTPAPEVQESEQQFAVITDAMLSERSELDTPAGPRRASIAVMPFADLSAAGSAGGDIGQALAHDVITRLAKLRTLFVIARGTVFALAERKMSPQEAARALNVDYAAGGTVQRHGGRLTISVELAETRSERIVWADTYDLGPDEIFRVLDAIGDRIVQSIASEIEAAERNRAMLKPPNALDAWEAYHRGLWHVYRFQDEENQRAQDFFRDAIRKDPTFSRPYAGLSFTHFQNAFLRWGDRRQEMDRAMDAAGRSLIADDRDPAAHWAMGRALWLRGDLDQSVLEIGKAVELSPNFALGHYTVGFVHCQSGDPRLAIQSADHSRHLSPFDPLLFGMLAVRALAHLRLGEFEESAAWAVKAAARPNAHAHVQSIAAHCLAAADRIDEARAVVACIHSTVPSYGIEDYLGAFRFARDAVALFRHNARRIGLA
jgi:DNA-binding SARP family transcriptional activator/TolB-like protein